MKRRIEEGRFIPVGGMWVESDNMIPSGESLVRQITFGRRYFKEHLGVTPRGIWLPDSFGYTGSWPQIARRAGFDWFLTQKISWNDTTKFPHHSFMWEGIDGTRILTHFPPSDTYCSWMSMHELMYSQRNFLDKDLSRNAILLYGFGDGGGGPTREMTARIRRDHDLAGVPKIEFGTPDQLFDRVRKDIVDDAQGETPVFKGELYLELHRATLTAQQDMKRGCRQEESMLRVAEYLCAAARIKNPDYVYPREELDRIWKTLLLNQFHDILPGSAIAWVHRQARVEYARDVARLNEIALEAGRAIAAVEPDDATITDAVIAPYSRQACEAWVVRPASSRAEAGTASMAPGPRTHARRGDPHPCLGSPLPMTAMRLCSTTANCTCALKPTAPFRQSSISEPIVNWCQPAPDWAATKCSKTNPSTGTPGIFNAMHSSPPTRSARHRLQAWMKPPTVGPSCMLSLARRALKFVRALP